MKWGKIAAIAGGVLAAIVFVFVVVGFFLPKSANIERSITVNAPQETVFMVANSLRASTKWSPWMDLDPKLVTHFEGPDSGVGQKFTWTSTNKNVGSGSQTVVESTAPSRVGMHIEFAGMGGAEAALILAPEGAGTRVTWTFETQPPGGIFGRYLCLLMKGAITKDYDKGLAKLKTFVEGLPKVSLPGFTPEHVKVTAQQVIRTRTTSAETSADMGRALGQAYGLLMGTMAAQHLTQNGPTMAVAAGADKDKAIIDAQIPVNGTPGDLPAGITIVKTYEGDALRVLLRGSYGGLTAIYPKLLTYALANGWTVAGPSWNEYAGDPGTTPADQIETRVFLPVK